MAVEEIEVMPRARIGAPQRRECDEEGGRGRDRRGGNGERRTRTDDPEI